MARKAKRRSRGVGIHIGLNKVSPARYEGWDGELTACENDARDMADIAREAGMTRRLLLTRRATRTAVRSALTAAARTLQSGDFCFVTYSGHGGQVPDRTGDEADRRDETWCLFDGELIDDELDDIWAGFRAGVRILVFSDSCHSGTVTRAAFMSGLRAVGAPTLGPRTRAMPRQIADRVYRAHKRLYDGIQAKTDPRSRDRVKATVILISGCQDNQESEDGDDNGLFTATLLEVWNGGRFRGGYRRFHRAIVDRMPPTQSPNYFRIGAAGSAFEKQKPFTL